MKDNKTKITMEDKLVDCFNKLQNAYNPSKSQYKDFFICVRYNVGISNKDAYSKAIFVCNSLKAIYPYDIIVIEKMAGAERIYKLNKLTDIIKDFRPYLKIKNKKLLKELENNLYTVRVKAKHHVNKILTCPIVNNIHLIAQYESTTNNTRIYKELSFEIGIRSKESDYIWPDRALSYIEVTR